MNSDEVLRLVEVKFTYQAAIEHSGGHQQFAVRAFLCDAELKIVFDLHGDRGPIEHLEPGLLEAIRVAIEGLKGRIRKEEMFEEE